MNALKTPPGQSDVWDLVIRPRRGLFDIPFRELWDARELISLLVWRDFISTYKQTILGPLWYVVQPVIVALTYLFVFNKVANLSTDGLPPLLFYLCGTIIWNFFSANLTKTSSTFISNKPLFEKVYFPRLAIPISIAVGNLISFSIQVAILVLFLVYFKVAGADISPNSSLLFLPFLIVMMAGLGLGFGIIVSALTTRYRDLNHLVLFGSQLLLFVTPVIYPVSSIPARFRHLIWINPMAPIVETFRYAFLGAGTVNGIHLFYCFVFTVTVLVVGLVLFNRAESTFMDTL